MQALNLVRICHFTPSLLKTLAGAPTVGTDSRVCRYADVSNVPITYPNFRQLGEGAQHRNEREPPREETRRRTAAAPHRKGEEDGEGHPETPRTSCSCSTPDPL